MSEQREYFRIQTFARVGLRAVSPEEVELARLRLKQRQAAAPFSSKAIEEAGLPSEHRVVLDLLERVALTLDRIDRRLDDLALAEHSQPPQSIPISLSGSGFSGAFALDVSPGEMVEAQLDLWESGLPLIVVLARAIRVEESPEGHLITAFSFEEIAPDDEERIVQLALRSQSYIIRENRKEERI